MEKSKRKKLIIMLILIVTASTIIPLVIIFVPFSFGTRELAQIDTGGMATDVMVSNEIAYVIDNADQSPGGLVIINVSQRTNPRVLGSYLGAGVPWAVDVAENIAFVANYFEGLEVINVSNPSNPIKIDQYTGSGCCTDVQVDGTLAYVADWSRGFVIFNVSDPANIIQLSRYEISGSCVQLHVYNDIACVLDHYGSYTGIVVLDISNPIHPIEIGSRYLPDVDYWNPFIVENLIYVGNHALDGGGLHILDMNNPSDISQVGFYHGGGSVFASFIQNDRAFLADYDKGLIVLDVSNSSNPLKVAQFFDGGHAHDVYIVEDIAYVADEQDGLEIIQIL